MTLEDQYGPVVRQAFAAVGLLVEWGMAIVHVETGGSFNPHLVNRGSGDAGRGDAWGLCQMTLETARGLGYTGSGPGLLEPELNCALAATLCLELRHEFGQDLHDVAAAYNSGKPWGKAPPGAQHYAGLVVSRAQHYARLFGHENSERALAAPEGETHGV